MKIRILTRKRVISVEVQAEGSRQHRPSSRTSPRTLPSLISQLEPLYIPPLMVCRLGMKERMNENGMTLGGVRGAPFTAQGVRFPAGINMETYGNRLMRIVSFFPPKIGPVGANKGSGDPGVRPTIGCLLSRRHSSWTLPGGPPSCVCRCRGFVGRFSLSNRPIL